MDWVADARARTLDLIADLDDDQLVGPFLPTINPLIWEIGHAAWFQEYWVLQKAGQKPIHSDDDKLFDSIGIAHEVRWDLPVPPRREMIQYVCEVRERTLELLDKGDLDEQLIYFVKLSVFHEDMHTEAFTYTRQTLAYPAPTISRVEGSKGRKSKGRESKGSKVATARDIEIPGGSFLLGSDTTAPFIFDNEKWAHEVDVAPFAISAYAVTQSEFTGFVDDGGYGRDELWSADGLRWRAEVGAEHPIYWKRADGGDWLRRDFDKWVALEPNRAMLHVNWFEADAFCRWAGRRLPTEVEWEMAAAADASGKRHYPWGDDPPMTNHANLDWNGMGCADVNACEDGDSSFGCRQMIGNVWEWTATTFGPFPGFAPDPYKEYSQSCFGDCKVLRGGCWTTRSRLIRNTWRNFYKPDRRDVWVGFRTCAT